MRTVSPALDPKYVLSARLATISKTETVSHALTLNNPVNAETVLWMYHHQILVQYLLAKAVNYAIKPSASNVTPLIFYTNKNVFSVGKLLVTAAKNATHHNASFVTKISNHKLELSIQSMNRFANHAGDFLKNV